MKNLQSITSARKEEVHASKAAGRTYNEQRTDILPLSVEELVQSENYHDRVKGFLLTKECDWIDFNLNVPAASHMGGSWERLIRMVRSVLSVLLQEHDNQLDDEALHTLMTEAENFINSRPLTVENLSDPESPQRPRWCCPTWEF